MVQNRSCGSIQQRPFTLYPPSQQNSFLHPLAWYITTNPSSLGLVAVKGVSLFSTHQRLLSKKTHWNDLEVYHLWSKEQCMQLSLYNTLSFSSHSIKNSSLNITSLPTSRSKFIQSISTLHIHHSTRHNPLQNMNRLHTNHHIPPKLTQ